MHVEFIKALHEKTEKPVCFGRIANDGSARNWVFTRDLETVQKFLDHHSKSGLNGLYASVGTFVGQRTKECIQELPALFADLDFSEMDLPTDTSRWQIARDALNSLFCPPSMIVMSGGGLHAYWILTEPMVFSDHNAILRVAGIRKMEDLLRQLIRITGADPQCCDVTRIMRLPGTRNTKREVPADVTFVDSGKRYSLQELRRWIDVAPRAVLRLKSVEAEKAENPDLIGGELNPFLELAAMFARGEGVDCEAEIAGMRFGNIHQVQTRVTASMAQRGLAEDEAVDALLGPSRGAWTAANPGKPWNDRIEERSIRQAFRSAQRKWPVRKVEGPDGGDEPVAGGGDNVVSMAAKKPKPQKAHPASGASKDQRIAAYAAASLTALQAKGYEVMATEGELWVYELGLWRIVDEHDAQWIKALIGQGIIDAGGSPTAQLIEQVSRTLALLPDVFRPRPSWIGTPGADNAIGFVNGVLFLGPGRVGFMEHAPWHFLRSRLEVSYVTGASCPKFLMFLNELFADRSDAERGEIVGLMQEWFGAALSVGVLQREQRKALLLEGPSRSGKTQLARVVALLFRSGVVSVSVQELSSDFGMQSLLNARAYIADDAISTKHGLDAERIKVLVTGEDVSVRRKGLPSINVAFTIPVLLTGNSLPVTSDYSDAVYNRFLVVQMKNTFGEDVDPFEKYGLARAGSVAASLVAEEGDGIAQWALAGLARLIGRGRFVVPESVARRGRRFREQNNIMAEFVRECVEVAPDGVIARQDWIATFMAYKWEHHGEAGGKKTALRAFEAAVGGSFVEGVKIVRGSRFDGGFRLNDAGLDMWQSAKSRSESGDKLAPGVYSDASSEVNRK